MAGTTNRQLMTLEDAKSRLLELDQHKSSLSNTLAGPIVRISAGLLVGAYLGHRLRRPRKEPPAHSIVRLISRAAATAAPMLVEHFVRAVMGRDESCPEDDVQT